MFCRLHPPGNFPIQLMKTRMMIYFKLIAIFLPVPILLCACWRSDSTSSVKIRRIDLQDEIPQQAGIIWTAAAANEAVWDTFTDEMRQVGDRNLSTQVGAVFMAGFEIPGFCSHGNYIWVVYLTNAATGLRTTDSIYWVHAETGKVLSIIDHIREEE